MSVKQAILLALRLEEGSYTYQIVARTKLNSKQVSRRLSQMAQNSEIVRKADENGTYLYLLKAPLPPTSLAKTKTSLENEQIATLWHRVALLRRMRDRTIEEYHPLLNAVINDYELFLREKEDNDD